MRKVLHFVTRAVASILGWLLQPRHLLWIVLVCTRLASAILLRLLRALLQIALVAVAIHARRGHRGQPGATVYWYSTAALLVAWLMALSLVVRGGRYGILLGVFAAITYIVGLVAMDWYAEIRGYDDLGFADDLESHMAFQDRTWGNRPHQQTTDPEQDTATPAHSSRAGEP